MRRRWNNDQTFSAWECIYLKAAPLTFQPSTEPICHKVPLNIYTSTFLKIMLIFLPHYLWPCLQLHLSAALWCQSVSHLWHDAVLCIVCRVVMATQTCIHICVDWKTNFDTCWPIHLIFTRQTINKNPSNQPKPFNNLRTMSDGHSIVLWEIVLWFGPAVCQVEIWLQK